MVFAKSITTLDDLLHRGGLELSNGLIKWAKDCPQHPRNWSVRRKAYNAGLVMLLDFFMYDILLFVHPQCDMILIHPFPQQNCARNCWSKHFTRLRQNSCC